MVQSSDRIRRWWAVPGSRVRAAGTRWEREERMGRSVERRLSVHYPVPSCGEGPGWSPAGY